ncbi:LysR family transcriptional regulator [Bordetella sp. BOR01]|uniref:LysR family transcriptional regulator n=1 Tax=Bordetella sp. BOR01 TaxID=2854779 RepID=UPI001C4699DC|nr:LysR family transcriptional regulator [Bordetella sp. BOR01]MBV7482180.1 LysR family transcriptional regulator [Bordetella sp. BOR01]
MHLKGLDLNLLVALDALLDHQNVTRAAEHMHVGQSAMSGSLGRLREHFGDPLLVPLGRKLRRTPLGEELVAPVRSILMQIEAVSLTQPAFDPGASSRTFRVMASDYGSTVVLAAMCRRIKDLAPSVGVEVLPFSDAPAESLEHGDIDALLIAKEYLSPRHPSTLLFQDGFACVAWSKNPLIGGRISLEQFQKLGHVVVKYGTRGVSHIEEKFFRSSGITRRVEVTVTSFNSIPHFVVGSHRIAMMHKRLATLYGQAMPLKLLLPPVKMPTINQSLQWHAYRENDPGGAWLRRQLLECAASLSNPATAGHGLKRIK